jgi:lipopolysaccharide heptosyltransferase II
MIFSHYNAKFNFRVHNIIILNIINILGRFFFAFLKNRKQPIPNNIKKILVIRTGSLGDVLLITPLLHALRESFPSAYIAVLIPPLAHECLMDNPYVNKIITADLALRRGTFNPLKIMRLGFRLRKEQFDLGLDLRGDVRNMLILYLSKTKYRVSFGNTSGGDFLLHKVVTYRKKHEIDSSLDLLRALGIEMKNRNMVLKVDESDSSFIRKLLAKQGIRRGEFIVGFHPSSSWMFKDWPAEKFAQLGDHLTAQYGAKVIILGKNKKDYEIAQRISHLMAMKPILAMDDLNLRQMVALIAQMAVFVCNSSAPAHLAAVTSTPTIVLFGSDEMLLWLHEKQIGLKRDAACSPCRQRRCKRAGRPDQCMNLISVEEVIEVIEEILRKNTTYGIKNVTAQERTDEECASVR